MFSVLYVTIFVLFKNNVLYGCAALHLVVVHVLQVKGIFTYTVAFLQWNLVCLKFKGS